MKRDAILREFLRLIKRKTPRLMHSNSEDHVLRDVSMSGVPKFYSTGSRTYTFTIFDPRRTRKRKK